MKCTRGPATCWSLLLVVGVWCSSVLAATDLDVSLVSLAVATVKTTHSVEGEPSKDWTVKAFVRNGGERSLENVDVALTAWYGPSAAWPAEKRQVGRRGPGTAATSKRIERLAPGKSVAVVFHVLTPRATAAILFGALADCDRLPPDATAAKAAAGALRGAFDEGPAELDNYKELQAKH